MGQRVLVVDDDPTVSDVVRRYLERAGLNVALAGDSPAGSPLSTALTVREFDLLVFLLRSPAAFTRAHLLDAVWGWTFGDQSTVTVHVRRPREKARRRWPRRRAYGWWRSATGGRP